jgi:hypothetical protein
VSIRITHCDERYRPLANSLSLARLGQADNQEWELRSEERGEPDHQNVQGGEGRVLMALCGSRGTQAGRRCGKEALSICRWKSSICRPLQYVVDVVIK